jgi:hypothetical protein
VVFSKLSGVPPIVVPVARSIDRIGAFSPTMPANTVSAKLLRRGAGAGAMASGVTLAGAVALADAEAILEGTDRVAGITGLGVL